MPATHPESPPEPDLKLVMEDPDTHQVEVADIYMEDREIPTFYVAASSPAIGGLRTMVQGHRVEDGQFVSAFPTPSGPASIEILM